MAELRGAVDLKAMKYYAKRACTPSYPRAVLLRWICIWHFMLCFDMDIQTLFLQDGADAIYVISEGTDLDSLVLPAGSSYQSPHHGLMVGSSSAFVDLHSHFGCYPALPGMRPKYFLMSHGTPSNPDQHILWQAGQNNFSSMWSSSTPCGCQQWKLRFGHTRQCLVYEGGILGSSPDMCRLIFCQNGLDPGHAEGTVAPRQEHGSWQHAPKTGCWLWSPGWSFTVRNYDGVRGSPLWGTRPCAVCVRFPGGLSSWIFFDRLGRYSPGGNAVGTCAGETVLQCTFSERWYSRDRWAPLWHKHSLSAPTENGKVTETK